MKFSNIFDKSELENANKINKIFPGEIGDLILLLDTLNAYLDKLNGKIKTADYPKHTILNFAAQNLQLINNAYILFTQGYLRSSAILLRTVSEQLILSMFFSEYPDKEKAYRETPYMDFFRDNKLEKMLSRIDREGQLFKQENFTEFNYWNRVIYKNLYEELSMFVHSDTNIIDNLMFDELTGKFHKTPHVYKVNFLKAVLRKLFESTLFTILILDKLFEPEQKEVEINIIKKAVEVINVNLKIENNNGNGNK